MDMNEYLKIYDYINQIALVNDIEQEAIYDPDEAKKAIFNIRIDNIFAVKTLAEVILQLEIESGKTPAQVYEDADISRSLYSSLICGKNEKPTKETVLALSIGLHLNEYKLKNFVEFCGYSFPSSLTDKIMLYFVRENLYDEQDIKSRDYVRGKDLDKLNEILNDFKCKLLGSSWNNDNL